MKIHKLLNIGLLILALASCTGKKQDQNKAMKPPAMVDVLLAGFDKVVNEVEVNGSALSYEMVELHPEVSGRIISINIQDGAAVTEGTVLVKLNDAELQAQLEQQKSQLELALKTEQRYKKLLDVNGINQSDYDVALNQLNSVKANIKVINAQIDKTLIRAPFTGQLGLRQVSPGAYVTPQTIICTIQQTNKLKVDFTVPEAYKNLVTIGSNVQVQTNGSDTREAAAIIAVEPQINPETRNLKVRAVLNGSNINPGTFVKVLLTREVQGILVPTNAIIPDALSNQLILVKNGRAVFQNVETGVRKSDFIEITKGLKTGDSIIINGVLFVRPNAPVKVRSVKQISDLSKRK